jgi:hypothetical protein
VLRFVAEMHLLLLLLLLLHRMHVRQYSLSVDWYSQAAGSRAQKTLLQGKGMNGALAGSKRMDEEEEESS